MFKITNKTNQTIPLVAYGYLYPYASLVIKNVDEQIKAIHKRGLISLKEVK